MLILIFHSGILLKLKCMIEFFFSISNKMETTEAETMKDVMNLLETEPPSESDHREQLAILVASGNCKEFLGVQLTQEQIKRLTKKDVEKFFKRYETSLSSKTCDAIVDTFIQLSCRGLAYFLPLDQEKLLNNLKKDFMVKRELYLIAGGLYLRYGSYMAAASAALLTLNNLKYEDLDKNLDENSEKNLEKNLEKIE